MDFTPDTSTSSVALSDEQRAADAMARVIALERWLFDQNEAMPDVPGTFSSDSPGQIIAGVDAFWDDPAAGRRGELSRRLSSAMTDLAELQVIDGTLDGASARLARRVTTLGALAAPAELREVLINGTVYGGALLIVDPAAPSLVVSFLPTRGWDGHTSLDDAHAAIEREARRQFAASPAARLLGRIDQTATSRTIAGVPFVALVERFIAMQRDQLIDAGIAFSLAPSHPAATQLLADDLHDILDLDNLIDIDAILRVREGRLQKQASDERLASVSASLANAWRRTRAEWHGATVVAAQRLAEADAQAVPELVPYTLQALGKALGAIGVVEEPESITLTLDRTNNPIAWTESLGSATAGPPQVHTTLLEAALRNVPLLDGGRLSASGSDGTSIPALDDSTIRGMLTALDVPTRYTALLTQSMRDGRQAPLRRQAAAMVQAAHMRHALLESRVASGLTEIAARWVDVVLDEATGVAPRRGHRGDIVAREVTYLGVAVRDVVAFAPRSSRRARGEPWSVFHTPDAPDNVSYRAFSSQEEAERLFLRAPAFREYLLDRLPAEFAEPIGDHGTRQFKANRGAHFIFNSGYPQGQTVTDGPFVLRDITGPLFDVLFDTGLAQSLRDVATLTRNAVDASISLRIDLWRSSPVQTLPAAIVGSAATAPFRILPPAVRAYDAARIGDYAQALVDLTESYVAALGAHPAGVSVRKGAVHLVRYRAGNGKLVERILDRPHRRFGATAVAEAGKSRGAADRHGLYRIDGEQFAVIDGAFYRAHYDTRSQVTRINTRPLEGKAAGRAIRLVDGFWRAARPSSRHLAGSSSAHASASGVYSDFARRMEEAFPEVAQRERVCRAMYLDRWRIPGRRLISTAERERFQTTLAQFEASIRTPLGVTEPLSHRLKKVPNPEIPERLYFYQPLPIGQSEFLRTSSDDGTAWGALDVFEQADSVFGVRLTSVEPTRPVHAIAAGIGITPVDRSSLFAVELRPRDIMAASASRNAPLELLSVAGSQGTKYILRTARRRPIILEPRQFELIDFLPAARRD
ncbi:hypothetical protein KPL74_16030 [Bacillus sp. NP157]|nr:hypothetical protein KPL74_16030 [Bacillus sp. NP157]